MISSQFCDDSCWIGSTFASSISLKLNSFLGDLTQMMMDIQFVLFKYGIDGIYSLSTHYIADNSLYIAHLLYQGLRWNSFLGDLTQKIQFVYIYSSTHYIAANSLYISIHSSFALSRLKMEFFPTVIPIMKTPVLLLRIP